MSARAPSSLQTLQSKLKGKTGRQFWRSLEELEGTTEFQAFLSDRFPALNARGINRRSLLKIMGASLALGGLSACKGDADEAAYPYVNVPEGVTPGIAQFYATAVTFGGYAQPVLGKTFAGRPVKLEGNPDHPASRGTTDAFTQAALLGLYDPTRSQSPRHLDKPADWDAFDDAILRNAEAMDGVQGDGFRLLTAPTSSPTLLRQIDGLMQRWPKARWHLCDPVHSDSRSAATRSMFGRTLDVHLAFDRAEVVVSFDDDFLGAGPLQNRNANLFADRRRLRQQGNATCHLMVTEPVLSVTGSTADRRMPVPVEEIGRLLQALGGEFGIDTSSLASTPDRQKVWLAEAADALREAGGQSLVLVGPYYPAALQSLALLINEKLGNFGTTMQFTDTIVASPPDGAASLRVLAEDMQAGRVKALAMFGVNPVHSAPAGLGFADAMEKVGLRIHAGLYDDETAALSHWHVPIQHDLESWSDARAVDGSIVLVQPLVRPFFDVRSQHVLMETLFGRQANDRELVQATWRQVWKDGFDARWQDGLDKGIVEGSALPLSSPPVVNRDVGAIPAASAGLTLHIRPDAGVWDGCLSDNAWAQETPRPISKITWGNVIGIDPQLAGQKKIENGDEVKVWAGGQSIVGAAWIMPGQAARTIALTLGYGRSHPDAIAAGLGYNVNALRKSDGGWHIRAAEIDKTGAKQVVATTQAHQVMDGFDFVRTVETADMTLPRTEQPSFYPARPVNDPSWGMSIDLDLCVGCNACVTACQAENNIPVVGKELVAQGREMHWIRIDHYFEGGAEEPNSYHQPVTCMHCEQAPCEMGCPVNAAVHSIDGLNLQIYNRCIGTRTCSSYCPYKVRRFNWFDFTGDDAPSMQAMRNPDVTVRSRGVMEKCTYCVQRIAEARITADKEDRPIRDGEIVTACQQACPSQAIVFGNVADPQSAVSRRKAEARDYKLLEEVNTRPRTSYLARIEDGPKGEGAAG